VIFVDDDSPDGTAEQIREISRGDRRVRCLQRMGRRGLTTAFIEGALATSAPYIAVMDADMQHDEKLLPQMLAILKSDPVDLVVGSRHVDILASSPRPLRVSELPYEFRERQHGESKLDTRVAWEYIMLIADKLIGHIVPVRFALFVLVGGIGLFIHMAVHWFALTIAGAVFHVEAKITSQ
jgi:glycosyltransferase involved in cell wall biosynthesis